MMGEITMFDAAGCNDGPDAARLGWEVTGMLAERRRGSVREMCAACSPLLPYLTTTLPSCFSMERSEG
jgi:hypothetical protein